MPETFTFKGRFHPYITMGELAEWLNAASDGEGRWSARLVQRLLVAKDAAVEMPARDTETDRRRASGTTQKRMRYVTTRRLLRERFSEIYDELMSLVSDREAQREADLLDGRAA